MNLTISVLALHQLVFDLQLLHGQLSAKPMHEQVAGGFWKLRGFGRDATFALMDRWSPFLSCLVLLSSFLYAVWSVLADGVR